MGLQKALGEVEDLDQRVSKLTLPLVKLQYACGYKQCVKGDGAGASDLSCFERCEAPLQEFAQTCESRMGKLMENLTRCFSGPDSNALESCLAGALGGNTVRDIETNLKQDVEHIRAKYESQAADF